MADLEKVISVLLDEKNWEELTGVDGVPSFAMDAVVLLKSQQAEIERMKAYVPIPSIVDTPIYCSDGERKDGDGDGN